MVKTLFILASVLAFATEQIIDIKTDVVDVFAGPLTSCGGNSDTFTLKDVTITPYPVQAGRNLTINASGLLTRDIVQGALLKVTAKLGGIQVFQKELDLCEEGAKNGKPCPIAAGDQQMIVSQEIPGNIPGATINLEIKANNADKTPIACLKGPIKVVKP
jgi:hypothetical protein